MRPYNFKKAELEELYSEGMTLRQIAKRLNCSADCIYDYFVKYGIDRRKKSRAANLLLLNTNSIFIENIDPMWLVGFVDGEGSFIFRFEKKRAKLYPMFSIAQNNKELLERIASCFPEIPFTINNSPANTTWNLRVRYAINCVKLFSFFDKYHVIGKKDQYAIWKFLIEEIIKNDFGHERKRDIFKIYKRNKTFENLNAEYFKIVGGEYDTNI